MVNMDGREGVNIKAQNTETECINFFKEYLGWTLLYKNIDLKFQNLFQKSNNRGIDSLFYVSNPYNNYEIDGILIDAKHIKDKNTFTSTKYKIDVENLRTKLFRINNSREVIKDSLIVENNVNSFRYGILFYRWDNFDKETFKKQLNKVEITRTTNNPLNFPIIIIVSNNLFSKYFYLFRKLKSKRPKFNYHFYLRNKQKRGLNYLSISYLLSDLIPFEYDNKSCILCLDEINELTFQVIYEYAKQFNMSLNKIFLANGNHEEIPLYQQKVEKIFEQYIELDCLNQDEHVKERIGGI